jgi:hypothetical protein
VWDGGKEMELKWQKLKLASTRSRENLGRTERQRKNRERKEKREKEREKEENERKEKRKERNVPQISL